MGDTPDKDRFHLFAMDRDQDRRAQMAIREIEDRPADLIRRYRTLCEASGIARASRVPLAPAVQSELIDLQRQLTKLLGAATSEAGGPADRSPLRETVKASPRVLTPVPRPEPAEEAPLAGPEEQAATIFTDGSAEGNPGPGGYCALVRIPGRPDRELSGSSIHTTNNKMELSAAIAGLRAVADAGVASVTIISDSEYLVKGMTEWLPDWERRGWKTAAGQPVKNQDLWQQLDSLSRGRRVEWQWIKGHAGHPENERCDTVATAAARRAARARPT